MSSKDNLGDKLKNLEQVEAGRQVMRGLPLMARLDGRGFSTISNALGVLLRGEEFQLKSGV